MYVCVRVYVCVCVCILLTCGIEQDLYQAYEGRLPDAVDCQTVRHVCKNWVELTGDRRFFCPKLMVQP